MNYRFTRLWKFKRIILCANLILEVKKVIIPGQGWMLQFSVILFGPLHSFPPKRANIFGSLMFVRKPVPHSFEHFPIPHSSHSQSTLEKY